VSDSLDQRTALAAPAPLSTTDREHLSAAWRILALEARDATERWTTSTGGPGDLAKAMECTTAARVLQELLARRSPR
jgi:hypothetical protein